MQRSVCSESTPVEVDMGDAVAAISNAGRYFREGPCRTRLDWSRSTGQSAGFREVEQQYYDL